MENLKQKLIFNEDKNSNGPVVKSVNTRHSKCRAFGFESSSLSGATTLYKLVEYDDEKLCWTSVPWTFALLIRNAGHFIKEGKAIFKKNVKRGQELMDIADRIDNDNILESDLFEINKRLKAKLYRNRKFKFIKVN